MNPQYQNVGQPNEATAQYVRKITKLVPEHSQPGSRGVVITSGLWTRLQQREAEVTQSPGTVVAVPVFQG